MSLPEPEPEPELSPEPEPWPNMSLLSAFPEPENGSSEPIPEAEPSFGPSVQGVLVSLAVLIIIVGSVGNMLVIIVIGRMRTGKTNVACLYFFTGLLFLFYRTRESTEYTVLTHVRVWVK